MYQQMQKTEETKCSQLNMSPIKSSLAKLHEKLDVILCRLKDMSSKVSCAMTPPCPKKEEPAQDRLKGSDMKDEIEHACYKVDESIEYIEDMLSRIEL